MPTIVKRTIVDTILVGDYQFVVSTIDENSIPCRNKYKVDFRNQFGEIVNFSVGNEDLKALGELIGFMLNPKENNMGCSYSEMAVRIGKRIWPQVKRIKETGMIVVIKDLRGITNSGLKTAKYIVESLAYFHEHGKTYEDFLDYVGDEFWAYEWGEPLRVHFPVDNNK